MACVPAAENGLVMRRLLLLPLLGVASWVTPLGASSPGDGFSARLECQRRPTPGRVLCEAELEVDRGELVWGDVLVVQAPEFALPLRPRVGPGALFMRTAQRQRLQLALAASTEGDGRLTVRARAVVCVERPRREGSPGTPETAPDKPERDCRAVTREVEARVSVGPITE
jgi:hypothetical protein